MKALSGKSKRCPVCKNSFKPFKTLQPCCAKPACMIAHAQMKKNKKIREENAKYRKRFLENDRPHQLKLTQQAFNKMIRTRDQHLPCVSCGKPPSKGLRFASHWKSVGAHSALRFHQDNCHASCFSCNGPKSGNIGSYRVELINRIGLDRVEWLEGPHDPVKWDCAELIEMRAHYRRQIREMENHSEQ